MISLLGALSVTGEVTPGCFSEEEHKELAAAFYDGKLIIGVVRVSAHQFILNVPMNVIEERTGETLMPTKILFWCLSLAAFVLPILASVAAIIETRMWAFLWIPVIWGSWLANWMWVAARSDKFWPSWLWLVFGLCATILGMPWFACLALGAILCHEWSYLLPTYSLRLFVVRNRAGFNLLAEMLRIRASAQS